MHSVLGPFIVLSANVDTGVNNCFTLYLGEYGCLRDSHNTNKVQIDYMLLFADTRSRLVRAL